MRGGESMTGRARDLRQNMTEAERALWYGLRRGQLGWRFRRQHPIPPYIVDFACLEAKLVVEADGGQHADSRDQQRDAYLRRQGRRILRFWNNDVLQNRAGVCRQSPQRWPDAFRPHPNPPPPSGGGKLQSANPG